MKIEITARPQQAMSPRVAFDAFAETVYADEVYDRGEIGVKVGLAVMLSIDNMHKAGENICDPHWSILVTLRKIGNAYGTDS